MKNTIKEDIMMDEAVSRNILLVDDDINNLEMLRLILETEGYLVNSATSGQQALDMVLKDVPDLVLLDVMMPKMDGYEVCQRLKAETATAALPVIFLSGGSSAMEKVKAFDAGGIDYIVKPFHSAEILARVQTHLALYRIQSQLETEVEIRTLELKRKYEELNEVNAALKRLLQEIDKEKQEIGVTVQRNIEKLVLPNIDKIVGASVEEQGNLRDTITRNLLELTQPLIAGTVDVYRALSPSELRVLNLIKQGQSSKEIATQLRISSQTVFTHRKNIRKKLNISGKKINLASFITMLG